MSYQNSQKILPQDLIEKIQEYVDGTVIYIPKKAENKKHWGTDTDTKELLASRNRQIHMDHHQGLTVKQLSQKYFLSEKSIQRILRQIS